MREKELSFITILIDISLLYILTTQKLNLFDETIIILAFFVHFLFIYALYYKKNNIIDYSHVVYVIYIYLFSLFIENKVFIKLILAIITMMIGYWIFLGKCPMGKYDSIKSINNLINLKYYNLFSSFLIISIMIVLLFKLFN